MLSRTLRPALILILLCAGCCIGLPATAAEGMITISYRGSGGSYIGDTVVLDGINTAGNATVLAITGPGLPAEGVPLYDLDGVPGSGNLARVDSRNQWTFVWDMSRTDNSRLQTARYYIAAWDQEKSGIRATTSLVLKRPEFYLIARPSKVPDGGYVELEGMAEKGVTYIRLDVTDQAGVVLRTYSTPVSAAGFFQHGFRIDTQPGQYYVVGSNPSMNRNLGAPLTVVSLQTPATTPQSPAETGTVTLTGTGETPIPTRAGNPSAPLAAVLISVSLAAFFCRRQ